LTTSLVPLSKLSKFTNGKFLPTKERQTIGKFNVYGANGIIAKTERCLYEKPVIVIGRVGANCGTIYSVKTASWITDNCIVSIPKSETDFDFLFYVLKFLKLNRLAVGSAQPLLTQDILNSIEIISMTLLQQQKIGKILFDLDKNIQNLQNQNYTLEQMAQAIFQSWFVDFDGVTEFEDSELGKIPKRWSVGNLGDICEIIMGSSPPGKSYNEVGDGIIFFQGKTDFGDFFPTPRMYCSMPKRFAEKNDVLFTVRAPVGSINVAKEKYCIGRGLASLRLKENHGCFLYFFLKDLEGKWNEFEADGTVFGSINKDDLSEFKLAISPIELRTKFNNIIKPIYNLIWENNLNYQSLTQTRDALLPKLMSGEIRV
jgi:type I restriction enzyme, S subunit